MTAILPGSAIGILGGGQLGRMLALEACRMGYRVGVLDPTPDCPASQVSDWHLVASLNDIEAVRELASRVEVITWETELVPAEVLARIESRKPVRPASSVLRIVQDGLVQKDFLTAYAFPQARYAAVTDHGSLGDAARSVGVPAVLKSRRAGYGGKGQVRVEQSSDLSEAWARIGHVPSVLETRIPFRMEVSVILYGKREANADRKMGHILLLEEDTDRALQRAEKLLADLGTGSAKKKQERGEG